MKRVIVMLIVFISLIFPSQVQSQQASISLELSDLTNLDIGGLVMSGGLSNQPRIARIVILPENKEVRLELIAVWKKDASSSFRQLSTFKTDPFLSRIIFNDEFGTIIKGDGTWDEDLVTDLVSKGKLTGILGLTVRLFDRFNSFLAQDYKELVFLNPSSTISIISPLEGNAYDVGSVVAIWTPVQGASNYKILASIVPDGSSSAEAALKGANPLIDNRDVGNVTSIDLRTILSREWIGGQKIVFSVTAIITGSGGGSALSSVPVTFFLNKSGEASVPVISAELLKLIEVINGQVSQDFINRIMKGEVTIEGITDETDQNMDQNDLQRILTNLIANKESIISIKFTPKN